MDGARLYKYLVVASELEPKLCTDTGALLSGLVSTENNRLARLLEIWDSARSQAEHALNKTGMDHQWEMKRMQIQHPGLAEQIATDFSARAHSLFPEWDAAEWRRLLFESAPKHASWSIPYRIWENRWCELFPLRLEIV